MDTSIQNRVIWYSRHLFKAISTHHFNVFNHSVLLSVVLQVWNSAWSQQSQKHQLINLIQINMQNQHNQLQVLVRCISWLLDIILMDKVPKRSIWLIVFHDTLRTFSYDIMCISNDIQEMLSTNGKFIRQRT